MMENVKVLYHSGIRINKEKTIYFVVPYRVDKNYNDTAFNDREDKIYNIDINNKELEKIKKDNTMTYDRFQEIIKNLPPHFQNCREAILEALEKYSDRQNLIQSFDNEKFYKVGFCDGVKMILDITSKKVINLLRYTYLLYYLNF